MAFRSRHLLFAFLVFCMGCQSSDAPTDAPPSDNNTSSILFTDVTLETGLGDFRHVTGADGAKWFPETMGGGAGFLDYDNDGYIDLLLVNGSPWEATSAPPALSLYRNDGSGNFSDVSEIALPNLGPAYGFGLAIADTDNDGDDDVLFTTLEGSRLLQNTNGVFTDITAQAGIEDQHLWTSAALFFDANRDGWLDLFIGSYVAWSAETDIFCSLDGETKSYCTPELYEGQTARYYQNNKDGTFSEATIAAGFTSSVGKTLGVATLDFNKDGWPDLAVSNDTQADLLYENNGDGTFTEKGQLSGIAYDENGKARAGMGIDTGIVDETGRETIFVGNFSKEMIAVFHHIGNGLFVDKAARSKIGRPSLLNLTFGLFLFDVDLDGDLDLFAANGHLQSEIENTQEGITYREAPHLFINDGTGLFEDAAPLSGGVLATPLVARGTAYADIDLDGDPDVLVTENGGPVHLWRNDTTPAGNYLRVTLSGTRSNRSGLDARVVVFAADRTLERRVKTGSSYLSQSEKTLTFGLGAASEIDSLQVFWPSGTNATYFDITAGETLLLKEEEPAS